MLAAVQISIGPRRAAVPVAETVLLLAAVGVDHTSGRVLLAAAACGLQTPWPRIAVGPIRGTHFTGAITDLGPLLLRSRRHRVDGCGPPF
ncbi:DUF1275 domain-containing protein [Mycobacterium kubicae]|uniref:DUF1275 family protein n=1 Tax=Mycobacterium kubicae TaxID=120959 RepID=UPI001641F798|nr:DUF1275 family protein [Mycobacterium kubicae]QNI04998.1 DUF1275 domain-containing protein [Mycobacterium kubicae]